MPRYRSALWFLAVIACFIANQLIEHKFIMIFMLFLLLLPIFSFLYTFWLRRKLKIRFEPVSEYIKRGEDAVWYVYLENNSRIQTLSLRLMLRANSLFYDQSQIRSTHLIAQHSSEIVRITAKPFHSGPFSLYGLSISLNDIFGFFRIKVFGANNLNVPNIYVLPLMDSSADYKSYLQHQLESGEFPAGKSQVLLDEIDRFRNMMSGDSLKLIHWKLSARMQEWIVKEFDKEDDRSVTVLLNLPELDDKSLSKEYHRLGKIRDFMLDHTYTAIQIFLSFGATVRLKTYQPELLIEEADNLNESELLRKQLAYIPHLSVISFADQLHDELIGNEHNIIYIATDELNSSLVTELRSLRAVSGGILLVYVSDSQSSDEEVKIYISQLEQADIIVEIANSNKINAYDS